MKRILFFTANDVYWGGSEELWLELAKNCLNKGIKIAICKKRWEILPPKLKEFENDVNVEFIFKGEISVLAKVYNKFSPGRFKIKRDELSKKQILKWKPDIAIVSQGNNRDGIDAMFFFKKSNINYFTISQAAYEGMWPDNYTSERMVSAYKDAISNFFVSKATKRLTELQAGEAIKNSKVISNPFSVPYHNSFPYPAWDTSYNLACVARYEFYAKGQDVLLEVMNDLKWKNRNIQINFYGSGQNEEGIRKLIKYFNLTNVSIKGFASPVNIWKNNHALILPSRFEGLPLSLVESMLCGRFGIVTNVSGNKEVIIDNVNGFIAEAPQAEYLDLAMERAWDKRLSWEKIGKNAKMHIKTIVPEYPGKVLIDDIISDVISRKEY